MKRIAARDFQRQFGKLVKTLRDGQSLEVTLHGKPLGQFTKRSRKFTMPDFEANLRKTACDPKLGDLLMEEFNSTVS